MNREKCKGCEWYGKPYWSINNPCDNCPRDDIQVITRWEDPTIKELQQELNKKNKIIEELKEDMESAINEAINNKINLEIDTNNRGRYDGYVYVLDKIEELESGDSNE